MFFIHDRFVILYFITNVICFITAKLLIVKWINHMEYTYTIDVINLHVVKRSIIDGVLLYNYELK